MKSYIHPINKRKLKADRVTAHIMSRLSDYLNYVDRLLPREEMEAVPQLHKKIHDSILETLYQEGVDVLTEYDRLMCGLPPRDENGWTQEELRIYENKKLELMLNPAQTILSNPINS